MTLRSLLPPTLAALLLASAACSHTPPTPDVPSSDGDSIASPDAKRDYEAGLKARDEGRWEDAQKLLEQVRFKYPYTSYAALSDLALADADFDRGRYDEAAEGYRLFLKLHPSHPKCDYASYRMGLAYYKDIPSNFFLFPSPAEKDQTSPRAAQRSFKEFLRTYPTSSLAPDAKEKLARVTTLLAQHEMAVADFYLKREHYEGATGRLEGLLADYPGSTLEPEALVKLGQAKVGLKKPDEAKELWERVIKDFPNSPFAPEAAKRLHTLP